MRDIELWHRIGAGDGSPEVIDALVALIREGFAARSVLLPRVLAWLDSPEVARRRVAVALLAGCTGMLGLRRIVAALDDDDATVRDAAVTALAQSCATQPTRWAHALFHARPDVRRLAAERTPDAAKVLLAWGRADPGLAPWCDSAAWPAEPIALVHDLWQRQRLTPQAAVFGFAGIAIETLREFFTRADNRVPGVCAAFARAATGARTCPPIVGVDAFETWLEIATLAGDVGKGIFGTLTEVSHASELPELRGRMLVAACAVSQRHGWHEPLAAAAFDADARWIAFDFVPAPTRRKALQRVWNLGAAVVPPPVAIVEDALTGELACDDEGRPSLAHAAAIAALLPSRRCRAILDSFSESRAIELAADDPVGWYAVTRLPPETAHLWWLGRIEVERPDRRDVCRTLLCLSWIRHNDARAMHDNGPLRDDPLALLRGLLEINASAAVRIDATEAEVLVDAIWEAIVRAPLAAWLPDALRQIPARGPVATLLGRALGHAAALFGDAALAAGDAALDGAVAWIEAALAPTSSDLLSLAAAWREASQPRVAAFVKRVLRPEAPPPAPRAPIDGARRLTAAEAERIATCTADDLDAALAVAYQAPCIGLTEALGQRRHDGVSLAVTAALVGCADGVAAVARELARFATDDDAFVDDVRHATLTLWGDQDAVPPLVDATLVAFERHAAAFAGWFESEEGSWPQLLEHALSLPSRLATRLLWDAVARVLTVWSWREKRRVRRDYIGAVVNVCVAQLDTVLGTSAARILVALRHAEVGRDELNRVRPRIVALAPAMTLQTHRALSSWLSLEGIAPRDRPGRRLLTGLPADERYELRHSSDAARLVRASESGTDTAGAAAVERLVELGAIGELALARALAGEMRHADLAIQTIVRWTSDAAIAEASRLVTRTDVAIERRFRVALAFVARGGHAEVLAALAVARDPGATAVSTADDWDLLESKAGDLRGFVAAAAAARDRLLADRALGWLARSSEPWVTAELRVALRGDGGANPALRRLAAVELERRGDDSALPLVLQWMVTADVDVGDAIAPLVRLERTPPGIADALVDLALIGGSGVATEQRVVELLASLPRSTRDPALARILLDGIEPTPRKRIVADRITSPGRDQKLVTLAKTFAWGVVRGRELTGRRFSIHMTPKREQWGFTYMGSTAIHVTPVPILAKARHGQDIVEGLILHEIGHHIWHSDKPALRIWKRASKEHLHQLLNLVADEHLERNLRSIDADFGDRIKRLDAHAFQHAAREIDVMELLQMLRGGALEVLAEIRPAVAYDPTCLRIDGGRLLAELDAAGHSFARFVRALRMGLGNRSGDEKVNTALAYFGAGFRHLDMHGLYRVTKALAALFGTETLLAHGFGGHESVGWDQREADIASDGILDSEVQREVERILEPPRGGSRTSAGGGNLAINVGAAEGYKKITKVVPIAPKPEVHASLAAQVGRDANRLRETLEKLGLGHRAESGRLRGHAIDRSRVRAVVLRGDPRMLRARELHVESDLFLGVVVDCSGSMSGANLDRARRFAVLVAEAARGLTGVDARFFGFTDEVIWDAGDAQRCAVAALEASGGNNDAAALHHVASVATKSHRRAKLIVMISDGLPTECTVEALRCVVRELTRRHHMCCAQVAVRPLSEICFPHYVLLDDENTGAAVRRFAALIARLVGRALAM